jgi:hypothetical protein
MSVREEEIRESLVALAVALDGLHGKVEEMRNRLEDDFPMAMISREVPASIRVPKGRPRLAQGFNPVLFRALRVPRRSFARRLAFS